MKVVHILKKFLILIIVMMIIIIMMMTKTTYRILERPLNSEVSS